MQPSTIDHAQRMARPSISTPPNHQRRVSAFIAVFLLAQLAIPFAYYLRGDPYDERFAWRMFSGIRLFSCHATMTEEFDDGTRSDIDLERALNIAWITHLRRNRKAVIYKFMQTRCDSPRTAWVRFVNECRNTENELQTPLDYRLDCQQGNIVETSETWLKKMLQ